MGTSGSGRFSDYSSKGEEDKCTQIIENELLENTGDYDYAKQSLINPPEGTKVHLKVQERIVVFDIKTGQSIGALSTEYEYLRRCIQVEGYQYHGQITSSDVSAGIVDIKVDLVGTKPKAK